MQDSSTAALLAENFVLPTTPVRSWANQFLTSAEPVPRYQLAPNQFLTSSKPVPATGTGSEPVPNQFQTSARPVHWFQTSSKPVPDLFPTLALALNQFRINFRSEMG